MKKKIPTPADVAAAPKLFAQTFLKILDKEKSLVPFRWNPVQELFFKNKTGRDLILKSRQLGMTTLIQGEIFRRAVTRTTNAITLTHNSDATTKIRLMADRFYDNCKFGDVRPARKFANATLTTYPEFDSTVAIATAGSLDTGRGDTYTIFHGSESAFWPDAKSILAGAMQGGNPEVILESTPNGAQGAFYEMCMEALEGGSIWRLHFFPWWLDANYKMALDKGERITLTDEEKELSAKQELTPAQIKWRRYKQKELGKLFIQEYAEDPVDCFIHSGFGYFGDVSHCFTAPFGAVYDPSHYYCAGLDFGQTVDFTALPVFDFTTKCQVDLLHINGLEWAEQRARIFQICKKWHIDTLLAEQNSIGSPNIEALRARSINAWPFKTTNESKASIMSSLNEALHNGGWQLLDIPVQRQELLAFVSNQLPSGAWQLAAAGEGHDDIVVGLALALRSGAYTVSDKDLQDYGADVADVEAIEIDDDMAGYRADTYGISIEQARAMLIKERQHG
jgi:hypothetical protein